MRAPALGQARTSCVHLLHKNLHFNSSSKVFTERALPKRLSVADDPLFSPISSSLMSPPATKYFLRSTFHLILHHCHKKMTFFSPRRSGTMSNSSCRHTWTILPQICQLTSQVYTGVTGRKERTLKPVRNPLCGKGWITGLAWTQAGIQQKILKLEVL